MVTFNGLVLRKLFVFFGYFNWFCKQYPSIFKTILKSHQLECIDSNQIILAFKSKGLLLKRYFEWNVSNFLIGEGCFAPAPRFYDQNFDQFMPHQALFEVFQNYLLWVSHKWRQNQKMTSLSVWRKSVCSLPLSLGWRRPCLRPITCNKNLINKDYSFFFFFSNYTVSA